MRSTHVDVPQAAPRQNGRSNHTFRDQAVAYIRTYVKSYDQLGRLAELLRYDLTTLTVWLAEDIPGFVLPSHAESIAKAPRAAAPADPQHDVLRIQAEALLQALRSSPAGWTLEGLRALLRTPLGRLLDDVTLGTLLRDPDPPPAVAADDHSPVEPEDLEDSASTLLRYLQAHPGWRTPVALRKSVHMTDLAFRSALELLLRDGWIDRRGRGRTAEYRVATDEPLDPTIVAPGVPKVMSSKEVEVALLKLLKKAGRPLRTTELLAAIGCSLSQLYSGMYRARRRGLVSKIRTRPAPTYSLNLVGR